MEAFEAAELMSVLLVCFHHDFWTVQAVLVVVNVVQYALNGPSRAVDAQSTKKSEFVFCESKIQKKNIEIVNWIVVVLIS